MVQQYDPLRYPPIDEDLPSSDETPVDNELQNLIPNLLLSVLASTWSDREDWFLGDMGLYNIPTPPYVATVPDSFLSTRVERRKRGDKGRLSYFLWGESDDGVPMLVLEVISETYNSEYDSKMAMYIELGALYCVIYNPDHGRRDRHEPFWLREVGEAGIKIRCGQGIFDDREREWLYWFDEDGTRYLSPSKQADQAVQRANQAEQQATQEGQQRKELLAKLRDLGIDPDTL